jgi:hypothetical protein
VEWVVREGVGAGGEINQALCANMNNKRKMKKKKKNTSMQCGGVAQPLEMRELSSDT